MDVVISQYDKEYLDALIRYNKALVQRNTLLKSEQPVEEELFLVWEDDGTSRWSGVPQTWGLYPWVYSYFPVFHSFISQDREGGIKLMTLMPAMPLCWKCWRKAVLATRLWAIRCAVCTKGRAEYAFGRFPHQAWRVAGTEQDLSGSVEAGTVWFPETYRDHCSLVVVGRYLWQAGCLACGANHQVGGRRQFWAIFITDTNREHLDHSA